MSKPKKKSSGLALIIIGFVVLAVGVSYHYRTRPHPDGIEVNATVIDVITRTQSDGDRAYAPLLEFELQDGTSFTFVPKIDTGFKPTVGAIEKVSYVPGEPGSARWLSSFYKWVVRVIVAAGVLLTALGFRNLLKKSAQNNPPAGSPDSESTDGPQSPIIR